MEDIKKMTDADFITLYAGHECAGKDCLVCKEEQVRFSEQDPNEGDRGSEYDQMADYM